MASKICWNFNNKKKNTKKKSKKKIRMQNKRNIRLWNFWRWCPFLMAFFCCCMLLCIWLWLTCDSYSNGMQFKFFFLALWKNLNKLNHFGILFFYVYEKLIKIFLEYGRRYIGFKYIFFVNIYYIIFMLFNCWNFDWICNHCWLLIWSFKLLNRFIN